MLFMAWLLEQSVREDRIGRLCRIIQVDYNNGCLQARHREDILIDHFAKNHAETSISILGPLLIEAHLEFNARYGE